MNTVAEAESQIAAHVSPLPGERVPLERAEGTVLRESLVAERDQPPYDRVTMDGIAFAHAAWREGCRAFRLQGTQGAGDAPRALADTQACIEVMTGSMLPPGTDTVVPFERLAVHEGTATVESGYEPEPGRHIHRRGSDRRRGEVLLEPGVVIRGPEMALAAAAGRAEIEVAKSPRVAVISTGNELIEVGRPIAPHQIRSCNDRAIAAALQRRGFERITRALLPDDPAILRERIGALHEDGDALILSGGVSMGKYDYVPAILETLGVELVFHKVSQRPGLPMWFGVSRTGKPVFALPGNPVSTLVCLTRYVIPALEQALARRPAAREWAVLAEPVAVEPRLTYFLPVVLQPGADGVLHAHPRPTNTSGDFVSLGGTDGFVELALEHDAFPRGWAARLYRW